MKTLKIKIFALLLLLGVSFTTTSCSTMIEILEAIETSDTNNNDSNNNTQDNSKSKNKSK